MSVRVGQERPLRMRRIGPRHVVVLPSQRAQLIDLNLAKRNLGALRASALKLERELASVKARIADLDSTIRQAEALPVERLDDDPDVDPRPPEPAAPAAVAAE